MHCLTLHLLVVFFTIVNSSSEFDFETSALPSTVTTSATTFTPYRYNRYIFFFFSENVTRAFLEEIVFKKLNEFDNYCGGEDIRTVLLYGSEEEADSLESCQFCPLEQILGMINVRSALQASRAKNISAGDIDQNDVNNVSATLIQYISAIENCSSPVITTQVIFITDYVTDSLKSPNTTDILVSAKALNINLIALTTNLTVERMDKYFPSHIWTVSPNYTIWSPKNTTKNPICGYTANTYTTPSQPFNVGEQYLNMFLFLSYDYVNRTNLTDVIDLLIKLTQRRWWYPCSQYRFMKIFLNVPRNDESMAILPCYVEESTFCSSEKKRICSPDWFRAAMEMTNWRNNFNTAGCIRGYDIFGHFFDILLRGNWTVDKFFIITDNPMPCHDQLNKSNSILQQYGNFSKGAPLTVIVIENENDKRVSSSYAPIFPATQLSNLYSVNNITEILSNINTSINFCLNLVPWLEQAKNNYHTTVWYFYLIGATILTALTAIIAFLIIGGSMKRRKRMRLIKQRQELETNAANTARNQDENKSDKVIQDPWQIPLESLDIDFTTSLGKGAFSLVHMGFLHGKAPVSSIFPSIALQQFDNCYVAVKTLPQHSSESDKAKFKNEIELMKDIGYHAHLISMLGCNCSIERPVLLMELAKQDLLHWLASIIIEPNLEKKLISIAWQVSDGMSYLSSKNFIHRDLAARNVLLNNEMKAMVGDYGLCKKIENSSQILMIPGGMLPLKWMALESLMEHQFSLKTDIWSFGVLLFEIFSLGEEPYSQMQDGLVTFLQEGKRLNKPRFADDQIYDVMNKCWQVEPEQRPDFSLIQSYFVEMLEKCVASYGYLTTVEEKSNT